MIDFIRKFKDLFKKPEEIDKEKEDIKIEEKQRLDALHKQARTPLKKNKLTIEDFERTKLTKKQKNKTLSSNF